ncbi:MAG TPA: APC family permease [Kofleriaceae bacterium]|nr:APC family permease [Kofleriaceae bacterium]
MALRRLLFGRTLANRDDHARKLNALEGVPAMGLDGLASAAYGPEAALTVLIPTGAAGLAYAAPVTAAILGLLAVLYVSYRQTISAYPDNGGGYIVSKHNLGTLASLVAAAALMIDYLLNVAVGISAGVAALVSAVPALHPHVLALCLAILALVTAINLRGTPEAARLFAVPTYLFVVCFAGVVAIGVVRVIAAPGAPAPVVAPARPLAAGQAVTLWLLLRTFAAGCTAMTGVEAVSNGISAFREPRVQHGHRTLTAISLLLASLLIGIAYLVTVFGIPAMDQTQPGYRSVLSQLTAAVVGTGVYYHITIASLLCVLTLSANTSFVDFPRLCRCLAADGFLPRSFAIAGRRLMFSLGILCLAGGAALLLITFGGITDRLIPLFAIGAFLTFTMSQAGMVVHWRRTGQRAGHRRRGPLAINALGTVVTGAALIIIVATKLTEGAWITIAVLPGLVLVLRRIKRYYDRLDRGLRDEGALDYRDLGPPIAIVVFERWNKLTDRALRIALQLSADVRAVHLRTLDGPPQAAGDDDDDSRAIRAQWAADVVAPAQAAGVAPPALRFLRAEHRLMHRPLLALVKQLHAEHPSRLIAVLLPEVIQTWWWQALLHGRRARKLQSYLLRFAGSRVVLIHIPWYLEEPRPEHGLAIED